MASLLLLVLDHESHSSITATFAIGKIFFLAEIAKNQYRKNNNLKHFGAVENKLERKNKA